MWYVIDKEGLATLCADKQDAETTAKEADLLWPKNAQHRVAQIVEVEQAEEDLYDLAVKADNEGQP
jgi:hypothetical protein